MMHSAFGFAVVRIFSIAGLTCFGGGSDENLESTDLAHSLLILGCGSDSSAHQQVE